MVSLTEIAQSSRKIVKYGLIAALLILILKLAFDVVKQYWEKIHPQKPPPPTFGFGKLPPIEFPEKEQPEILSYKLESKTGELPELASQTKVFLSPYQRPNLLASENAKKDAQRLAFTQEPQKISENIFRWTKTGTVNSILEMNIFSGSFTLFYNWQNYKDDLLELLPPNSTQAIEQTKSFLKKVERLEDDLMEGRFETEYLKIQGLKMVPATSLSEANLTKVEVFRKNIEDFFGEIPVITADPEKGIVSLIFSSAGGDKKILRAEFNHFPINYESFATYPIKTTSQAWEELKNNQAFVSRWQPLEEKNEVIVRNIYLAFYDSWEPQQYLQPVFVFEGDDDFQALLPAITEE